MNWLRRLFRQDRKAVDFTRVGIDPLIGIIAGKLYDEKPHTEDAPRARGFNTNCSTHLYRFSPEAIAKLRRKIDRDIS